MCKIKEIQIGETQKTTALITKVEERSAKNGSPFLDVEITDGDKKIITKVFDFTKEKGEKFGIKALNVMNLTLECRDFQGSPSYILKSGKVVERDPSDFLIKVRTPAEEMLEYLKSTLMKFPEHRQQLRITGLDILGAYQEAIRYWYGSNEAPHNLCGGLLYHMYNMTKGAERMAEVYDFLDKEVLIFSAMFCSIGKLQSLLTAKVGTVENTKTGMLLGSSYLGMEMLKQEFAEYAVPEETAQCVLHCVAACYGEENCSSLVRPLTAEAKMVRSLNYIDDSMQLFSQTLEETAPGSFSGKITSLGTPVYHPLLD